jgi:Cof subfamily protein (haloacid dehalogenase superfamily)
MIKALFLDIDGTLVSFKTHHVPSSTIDALMTVKAKGIKVFISTGRPKAIINNLGELEQRNLIDGYVSMNGAYCFVGNTVIEHHCIPHQSVLSLGHYVEQKKAACVFVTAHDVCVFQENKLMRDIFYDFLHVDKMRQVSSVEEAASTDIYQVTPFISLEEEAEIISQVVGCTGDRWHPTFTDITAEGCDKRHGVEQVAAYFGLNMKEVICFGDGGNDISMLQSDAIGVAMGNAVDSVKAAADYVTTTVDDNGIRNALQHFGLI